MYFVIPDPIHSAFYMEGRHYLSCTCRVQILKVPVPKLLQNDFLFKLPNLVTFLTNIPYHILNLPMFEQNWGMRL